MTEGEITELFIRAAETERRLPNIGERPEPLKAQALPFVHSYEDMAGWGKRPGQGCQLLPKDDGRLSEERERFWTEKSTKVNADAVTAWERCRNWTNMYVQRIADRRALWAWAFAKAGGRPFNDWCRRVDHIHEETGRRRKNRAIAEIAANFVTHAFAHSKKHGSVVLPDTGQITYFVDKISEVTPPKPKTYSWMSDDCFSPVLDPEKEDFTWADKRNQMRRQRRAEKLKQQAA